MTGEINSKFEINEGITLKKSCSDSPLLSAAESPGHSNAPAFKATETNAAANSASASGSIVEKYELDCLSATLQSTIDKLSAAKKHREANIASQLLVDLHEGKVTAREAEQILPKIDRSLTVQEHKSFRSRILISSAIALVIISFAAGYVLFQTGALQRQSSSSDSTAPASENAIASDHAVTSDTIASSNNKTGAGNLLLVPSSWKGRSWLHNVEGVGADTLASFSNGVVCLSSKHQDDSMVYQSVTLKPHTEYVLSGLIKTEDVRVLPKVGDYGANLSVWSGWERSQSVTGTHDWTPVECAFDSGNRTSCELGARLGHYSSGAVGKAWFKNLKLTEVPTK